MWYNANRGTLVWPCFRYYHTRFQVICLLFPSVHTLCLKDPQMANVIIHLEILLTTGRGFVGASCLYAGNSKTRKTLCKQLAIIYWIILCNNNISSIFMERNCHFIIQTAYSFSTRHRSTREREKTCIWTETPTTLWSCPERLCNWFDLTLTQLTTDNSQLTNFQNSVIFIYSKMQDIICAISSHFYYVIKSW